MYNFRILIDVGIDMKACVFFGHAQQNYDNEYGKIEGVIEHLIKKKVLYNFIQEGGVLLMRFVLILWQV